MDAWTGISAEARGKRRQWLAQRTADNQAARTILFAQRQHIELNNFMFKATKGRRRIFERLHAQLSRHGARLEALRLDGKRPVAIWAISAPRPPRTYEPTRPGDAQDCVALEALHFGWAPEEPDGMSCAGLWSLETTVHAVGRFFERGDGTPDAAIFALHHALLNVDEVNLRQRDFKLRIGDDVWVVEPRPGVSVDNQQRGSLHMLVRTHFDFDQLTQEQEVGIVVPCPGAGEDRLGEGWLAPPTFRRIVPENGKLVAERYAHRPQLWALEKARANEIPASGSINAGVDTVKR